MPSRGRVDGVGLAAVGAGTLFLYAGIKGKSIPSAVQSVIQGKDPRTAAGANPITAPAGTSGGGTGGGGTGSPVPAGASERSYFTAFCHDLGAPVTTANLQAMFRWALKEEPSFPPPNSWNPLNIKNPSTGSFAQYPSSSAGAFQTAAFMINNHYPAIVASLRTGNGIADGPEVASELLAWSGGGYSSVNHGGG